MRLGNIIGFLLILDIAASRASAADAPPLDESGCRQAFAALERPLLLRAEFTQEKTLPDVARPLRAKGELLVSAEYGVILRTLSPEFAQSTKVMSLRRRTPDRSGVEARIYGLVRSVLAGEFGPLAEFFSAQGIRTEGRLSVTLTPKVAEVRAALSSIELRFGAHLEEIVVHEAGGGRLRLGFTGFRLSPPLSPDELRNFTEAATQ